MLTIAAAAVAGGLASASGTTEPGGDGLSVAYLDGSCGNSWRVHVRAEFDDEIANYPEVTNSEYVCAQGDLNTAISAIQGLTAQGVDALIVFSDWGEALLPALREAYEAGVVVVPWNAPVGGEAGTDYTAQVGLDFAHGGELIADYFIEKLGGEGTLVGVGGPAGNDYDAGWLDQILPVLESESDIEFLELAPADWSPATSAQVMAQLIAKYPEIDGVWSMEATTVQPEIEAFLAAGVPPPVFVSLDVNGLMGEFPTLKEDNPSLEWGFLTALTWGVRNAVQIAMAELAGDEWDPALETLQYEMYDCVEDCDGLYRDDMPDSYIPTSRVPAEDLVTVLE
jgi:ribose transport system substrate-binding protein